MPPRPVPRFDHGSRVPGWDEAVDLTKPPAVGPRPGHRAVPRSCERRSRPRWPSTLIAARPRSRRCTPPSACTAGARRRRSPGGRGDAADPRLSDFGREFYDMLETYPRPKHDDVYVCTNISCSLLGADELFDAMVGRGRRARTSTCARSSASAPATSRRWPRSTASTSGRCNTEDSERIVEDLRAGRPVLRTSSFASGAGSTPASRTAPTVRRARHPHAPTRSA